MTLHDDELPEDHATLLRLAADVQMPMAPVVAGDASPDLWSDPLPRQRGIDISDQATDLVGDPLVGLITHGR